MALATTQPVVITKTIESAVRLLDAAGCKYKIISAAGEEHGTLQVVNPANKKRKMNPDRQYGELRKYYSQFVTFKEKIGDVIVVPAGKYPPEDLRSGICANLSTLWGNGTYISTVTDDKIEILRTA